MTSKTNIFKPYGEDNHIVTELDQKQTTKRENASLLAISVFNFNFRFLFTSKRVLLLVFTRPHSIVSNITASNFHTQFEPGLFEKSCDAVAHCDCAA